MKLQELANKIERRFSASELKELFFKLSVDYDDLPGTTRKEKIRELVLFCDRHDKLNELVNICKELRPSEIWGLNKSFPYQIPKPSQSSRFWLFGGMIVIILAIGLIMIFRSQTSNVDEVSTTQVVANVATPIIDRTAIPTETATAVPTETPSAEPTSDQFPVSTLETTSLPLFSIMVKPGDSEMYTIEAEDESIGIAEIKPRSEASGEATVFVDIGGSIELPLELIEPLNLSLRVRYSHAFYRQTSTSSFGYVTVFLDNEEIYQFSPASTGKDGFAWNVFALSEVIPLGKLSSGNHTLRLFFYSPRANPGVEIDAIILVPSPYSYVLEDFEGDRLMNWWVPEADVEVYKYDETFSEAYTGEKSFSIEYHKSDTFQFIGAELPPELRNLSTSMQLEMWVYGEVDILLKLQDEELKETEVEIQSASKSNQWNRLQFDLSRVTDQVDLMHIKNFLFFVAPGNSSSNGIIFIDNIAILSHE